MKIMSYLNKLIFSLSFSKLITMPPKKTKTPEGEDGSEAKKRKISPPVNVEEDHRVTILSHVRDNAGVLLLKEFTPAFTKTMHDAAWLKVWEKFKKLVTASQISDGSNTILSNIERTRTSFIERTRTCSSIGDRTRTPYFWL